MNKLVRNKYFIGKFFDFGKYIIFAGLLIFVVVHLPDEAPKVIVAVAAFLAGRGKLSV